MCKRDYAHTALFGILLHAGAHFIGKFCTMLEQNRCVYKPFFERRSKTCKKQITVKTNQTNEISQAKTQNK